MYVYTKKWSAPYHVTGQNFCKQYTAFCCVCTIRTKGLTVVHTFIWPKKDEEPAADSFDCTETEAIAILCMYNCNHGKFMFAPSHRFQSRLVNKIERDMRQTPKNVIPYNLNMALKKDRHGENSSKCTHNYLARTFERRRYAKHFNHFHCGPLQWQVHNRGMQWLFKVWKPRNANTKVTKEGENKGIRQSR